MKKGILTISMLILSLGICFGQKRDVLIDQNGIMRWSDTKVEVQGFGVNYTVPFAHGYRSAMKLGIDPKEAIDKDVYHFARLGFDAYRVHVWDTEISDTLGNLLSNEHLDVFDYMLKQMKDRGMNYLITPIAFWGNGWPEPDTYSPGFSRKYGKDGCLTSEDAIKAQENYLYQFLNHVNPYTGVAYKDDPSLVAFEVSNEPHHRQPADSVTRYIKKMVTSMRKTGCAKPILYNISHGIHLVDAYFDAGVQGGTFQWYPTGLGFQKELQGNFLPNVNEYKTPFAENPRFKKGAKVVYEFDAADIGRSYIYPAMARSFRTAGIQWATHFAYEPTYLAYANTEYNTHYMNLVYTPQKALALKIASEVFHQVPLYKDYGHYPENSRFDGFHVSYEDDLAEYASTKKFIYSNSTTTKPADLKTLEEIAGFGNSEVVNYQGKGAYFLDKIEKGVWRLEVLPDAIWTGNPFGRNSLDRPIAVIQWNSWTMKLVIPELGTDFSIRPINAGNTTTPSVSEGTFDVRPGTYLVIKNGSKTKLTGAEKWKNIQLNEFTAPKSTVDKLHVLHSAPEIVNEGQSVTLSATVIGKTQPEKVSVLAYVGWRPTTYEMIQTSAYAYEVTLPSEVLKAGFLRYFIVVKNVEGVTTYPGVVNGKPGDWDFDFSNAYSVSVVPAKSPIYLFNAGTDNEYVSRNWSPKSQLVPLPETGKGELQLRIAKLFVPDEEDMEAKPLYDYSMRYSFRDKLEGRTADLQATKNLIIRGRSLKEGASKIQVALISSTGQAYGGVVTLDQETQDYTIPLSELKPVDMVTLPRPYPTFLPYYFDRSAVVSFDMLDLEVLQISLGPSLSESEQKEPQAVGVESVRME